MEIYSQEELLRFSQITQSNGILRFVCAIICFIIAVTSMNRRRELKGFKDLVYVGLSMGFWNLMLCFYWLVDDLTLLPFFDALMYVGVAFSAYSLFRYCMDYCFPSFMEQTKKRIFLNLLGLVPLTTSILALTFRFQHLFETYDITILKYTPCRDITIVLGPWFYVHSVFSYALILLTATIFLVKSFSRTTKNRGAFITMAIAITGFAIQNFIANFAMLKNYYGYLSAFFHLWCVNAFYWTSYYDSDETLVFYAKRKLFDTLSMPFFVFNTEKELIVANPTGKEFLKKLNIPDKKYTSFDTLFDPQVFVKQDFPDLKINVKNTEHENYFYQNKVNGEILHVDIFSIANPAGKKLGNFMTLLNTSSFLRQVRKLEEASYIDSLCQCRNRLLFELKKKDLMKTLEKPLALLVADLDDVKKVNDNFGHDVGDDYLRAAVDIIKKTTGAVECLFRLGGDEFLVFLENRDETDLRTIQTEIEDECKQKRTFYSFHISTGYSIIHNEEESFDKYFEIAMYNMHEYKTASKKE